MAEIHIGDVKATRANYRDFLSDVPFMYSVDGLPAGERAIIALFGQTWKILRIVDEVPSTWSGAFLTPQAAIAALAPIVGGEPPSVAPGPQANDGVAKQNDDGRWSVYRVESTDKWCLLEGPYDKHEAIERLRTLVPVNEGDQWVIDVWGVSHTLN